MMAARRVLVIEDNVDSADAMGMVLQVQGHEVALAYTGTEGLEKARELRPEVILCDIGLPGMTGYGIARAVRNDESIAATFLVALTGYAAPQDIRRSKEAGFDAHLAKPLSFELYRRILDELRAPADS